MHELLSPKGTLYVHLDWHACAYARVLLDEIFGPERLLNEIVWTYHGPSPIRSAFSRKHDTILVYTKSEDYTFNADEVRVPYKESTVKTFESSSKAGFGKTPDLKRGKVPEDWWYFPVVARLHSERTGYPTQKPEALLERVILASSNPNDMVGDFFAGSGTTPLVAQRLGRRWIACDAVAMAVVTTYRRLLLEAQVRSFELWERADKKLPGTFEPQVEIGLTGRRAEARLVGLRGDSPGEFPDSVVLWEVDWELGADCFESCSRSVRGFGSEALSTSLSHTYTKPGRYVIGARVALSDGQWGRYRQRVHIQ
jgi:hypothetical protein